MLENDEEEDFTAGECETLEIYFGCNISETMQYGITWHFFKVIYCQLMFIIDQLMVN